MAKRDAADGAAILDREEVRYDSIYRHGARRADSLRWFIWLRDDLSVACTSRAPQEMKPDCIGSGE